MSLAPKPAARDDGFEIFTHPERIIFPEAQINVA